MSPGAKENLNEAITCLNLSTKPGISKARKEFYKTRAVALTKEAISKCPEDVQPKINETLSKLETRYAALKEQINSMPIEVETMLNEQGEAVEQAVIDPLALLQNIKAELIKTAQAALDPLKIKLEECQKLNAKLVLLIADPNLSSLLYSRPFDTAKKFLERAEKFYRAGNFTLGDQQYGYAHRLADAARYMELRTKLGITRESRITRESNGNLEELYTFQTTKQTKDVILGTLEANPKNTLLKNYWSAVSSLKAAGEADSAAGYDKSIQDVETYLKSQKLPSNAG